MALRGRRAGILAGLIVAIAVSVVIVAALTSLYIGAGSTVGRQTQRQHHTVSIHEALSQLGGDLARAVLPADPREGSFLLQSELNGAPKDTVLAFCAIQHLPQLQDSRWTSLTRLEYRVQQHPEGDYEFGVVASDGVQRRECAAPSTTAIRCARGHRPGASGRRWRGPFFHVVPGVPGHDRVRRL